MSSADAGEQASNTQKSLARWQRQFQSTHTKSHRVIGGQRDKWPGCNFQEISPWLNTNRKLMNMRTKICHEAGRPSSWVCFLFAGQESGQDLCCQSKLLNYITHESDHVQQRLMGSPHILWPPSCRDHLLRRLLWRWWGNRMFGRTPAPPAGWRWGHLFLGPQVHLDRGGLSKRIHKWEMFYFKRYFIAKNH